MDPESLAAIVFERIGLLESASGSLRAFADQATIDLRSIALTASLRGTPPAPFETEALEIVLERARRLIDEEGIQSIDPRDARRICAALHHPSVEPAMVETLLGRLPALWSTVWRAYLGQWEHLAARGRLENWAKVLSKAPAGSLLDRTGLGRELMLRADAPDAIANRFRRLDGGTVEDLATDLGGRGLQPRWSFSLAVLAAWIASERASLGPVWRLVSQTESLSRGLLINERAPGKPLVGVTAARLDVLAAILRAHGANPPRFSPADLSAVESWVFDALGDPRWGTGRSEAWRALEERHRDAYEGFVGQLCVEDFEFFFRSLAEKDEQRIGFWRMYLGALRRTLCVLPPAEHQRLEREARTADDGGKLARIVRRARAFTSWGANAAAFCLDFGSVVAVEFSVSGNAAYFYSGHEFRVAIEPLVTGKRLQDVSGLKRGEDRLVHRGEWQRRFAMRLGEEGVRQTPVRRSPPPA